MIRHIIFFRAREPRDLLAIKDGLDLLKGIDAASLVEVAYNTKTDLLSREIDIVVYAEFPDEAALERFRADPLYERSIARVRPLRDLRIAADIEAETRTR